MATLTETVVQLPLDKLIPSPDNPPGRTEDVGELAESIRTAGIVEPLIVVGNGHNSHVVVAGHRRLAAAKLAGLTTAPCIVRAYDETQLLTAMLVENLQRKDLTPLEEAQALAKLQALPTKPSTRDMARWIGKSQPHVVKRLALLKLAPAAVELFNAGKVPVEEALVLANLPEVQQERVLKETICGSMQQRVRELAWQDEEKRRAAELAKRPKSAHEPNLDIARHQAARRKKDNLRKQANAERARLLPRIVSRGERELQFAIGVLARTARNDEGRIACEVLKITAPKSRVGGSFPEYDKALERHAAKSKKNAIEVAIALALANGETQARSTWAGPGGLVTDHIRHLQKIGYKPNARDRALLKGRRR